LHSSQRIYCLSSYYFYSFFNPLNIQYHLQNAAQQGTQSGTQPGIERLDAQLLMLHALGRSQSDRAWLITHDDEELSEPAALTFHGFCQRRLNGEPVAYIVGSKPFFGLDLQVDKRVLVPRPDTETLVEWALTFDAANGVLDMGTGSGAIALALKSARPDWQVTALDASPDALDVAQSNSKRLNLNVNFLQSSWFDALTESKFDLIVSNPPYIVEGDWHMAALTHEPKQALTSGADGLDDIRKIIQQAPDFLTSGGWLLLEHGYDQADAVRDLLVQCGFKQVQSQLDLAGIERCTGGEWVST
jgi:release factor glutamine methyltransferase